MKKNRIHRAIQIAAIVCLTGIAFANPSFAGPRPGFAGHPDGPRFQDNRGLRWSANLSDEQIARIEKLRTGFHAATSDLRSELRSKEFSLRAELAKKNPDPAAAVDLQKQVSSLRADLDAKRLAHRLEVKKVAPDAGGYGMGPRHGRGGHGKGAGRGLCRS